MLKQVNYYRTTINESNDAFSLEGCINPVFQNMGNDSVLIDGTQYDTGDSFAIQTDGLEIAKGNNIPITFISASNIPENRNIIFRCVKIAESKCNP